MRNTGYVCLALSVGLIAGQRALSQRRTPRSATRIELMTKGTSIEDIAFSACGQMLASCDSASRQVLVWSLKTNEVVKKRIDLPASPRALAFSASGRELAIACGDKGYVLWDLVKDHCEAHELLGACLCVKYSQDGSFLAASCDNSVSLLNARNGKPVITMRTESGSVTSIDFSPDSTRVAIASSHGDVVMYDAACKHVTSFSVSDHIRQISFGPATDQLTIATLNSILIRDYARNKEIDRRGGFFFLTSFTVNQAENSILISTFAKTPRYYTYKWRENRLTCHALKSNATAIRISPDAKSYAIGYGSPYGGDEANRTIGGLELWIKPSEMPASD